jgi:hypothetical protein
MCNNRLDTFTGKRKCVVINYNNRYFQYPAILNEDKAIIFLHKGIHKLIREASYCFLSLCPAG